MTGVTKQGWVSKSYDDIVGELESGAKEYWGDVPTTPDSVIGQIINIFANSTKSLWDLGQAITDTQNRDSAEGIYLDYLAEIIGLSRLKEIGSNGYLLFTGAVGAEIPAFFPCKDSSARNVLTQEDLVLNRSACYKSTFSINSVVDETPYTIVVEGVPYTYTTGTSDTEGSILEGLNIALSTGITFTSEVIDSQIIITYNDKGNSLSTTNTAEITLDSVGGLVLAVSATSGALTFPSDSITQLGSSSLEIDSVTNPWDFEEGREDETDEELRIRMSNREQSTGTATKPSIEASISEIDGVTNVFIVENETLTTDPLTGIPAKSYTVYVTGGNDADIAQVIWRTKPATARTYGTTTVAVVDTNGDTQSVSFSRKEEVYAWMNVTYTLNTEETTPSDVEEALKASVVSFGNSMDDGEDYEPTKFYAPLYAIPGVYISSIEIAVTTLPTDTPVYQPTRVSIPETTTLNFNVDRIFITG